jgi:hypothetical protein
VKFETQDLFCSINWGDYHTKTNLLKMPLIPFGFQVVVNRKQNPGAIDENNRPKSTGFKKIAI